MPGQVKGRGAAPPRRTAGAAGLCLCWCYCWPLSSQPLLLLSLPWSPDGSGARTTAHSKLPLLDCFQPQPLGDTLATGCPFPAHATVSHITLAQDVGLMPSGHLPGDAQSQKHLQRPLALSSPFETHLPGQPESSSGGKAWWSHPLGQLFGAVLDGMDIEGIGELGYAHLPHPLAAEMHPGSALQAGLHSPLSRTK